MAPMLILAMIATVAMLIWMGFFMMGSLPLLILKHDTPLDARFIRGLFGVYYMGLIVIAPPGALVLALAGKPMPALAFGGIVAIGVSGRRWIVGGMDALRLVMTADDAAAIRRFRMFHIGGMLLNMLQLGSFVFGMTRVSL